MLPDDVAADGRSVNPALVKRLVASQFPDWADLPLTPLSPAGSDNVIYRLGDTMGVRLPRGEWAAGLVTKEHYWLPRLAPHLPLPVPVPLGVGHPEFGYPWDWSVSRWLPGETATVEGLADPLRTANELAGFLAALQDSRVAAGGTALDPEVVTQLLAASRHTDGLGTLTPREREVLALMAEGRSNGAIAATLFVSERAVEKHVANIFSKLGLAPSDADHRRVLAVLRYLGS
jgi:DNA-binding CsgD family transcriptional regulator